MSHTLIVLPDDTSKPILDAINGAKKSLNIRMFLFTDETLLSAVIAAKRRGVEVRDSNPKFDLTHQKSMVIDDEIGFVESLNWEPRDLTETRDYAIVTTHDV